MQAERSFKPALVGRSSELAELRSRLERALAGDGSAVLVSGEAGIGKSRLCEEALATAEEKGASVARGWCVESTLEPLHPVREALAGLGIAYVLDDDPPPELLCLYLIDQGGVLVASAAKPGGGSDGASGKGGVDADIFSGMLQAISNFAKDSLSPLGAGQANLGSISYGNFRITLRSRSGLSLASITMGRENEPLLAEMDELLSELGPGLSGWSGNVAETDMAKSALESLVRSGRYEGRHLVDDPGLRKNGLLSNILAGLSRKAAEKPIVLYLDDLQWADPTTVSLVHYLARSARGTRMLILGTFRPEDVAPADGKQHPLASAMKTMSREGVVSIIGLERLETERSRDLVESALEGSTLEEAFYSRLQREGGGNPFYTLELLRLLRESGVLSLDEGGRWRLAKAVDELEMPERVADIVNRRFDRMPPEDARLLSAAAVLGEEFALEALGDLTGAARMDLLGRLDFIECGTGLVRSGAAGYRFDHSKVREAAYGRMGAGMRRELHRMAAESMLRTSAPGKLSEIALHLHNAGDPRAPAHLVAAARDAKRRFAIEEAAKLYRLAKESGDIGRDAMMELGDCERYMGLYDSALTIYEGLLPEAAGQDRGKVLTLMAEAHDMKSDWPSSLRLGGEAFAILEPLGPSAELTRTCHVMYYAHLKRGEVREAESWARRQMEIAGGSGDEAALASAEHVLGTLFLQTRRFDEALPHLEKAAAGRRALADLAGLGASLNNIGAIHHSRGAWEKAAGYYREALSVKRSISDLRGIASTAGNLGIISKNQGDPRGALRYMEEALGIRKRIGDLTGQCSNMIGIGLMWQDMMEFEKAENYISGSRELAERIGDLPSAGTACANLGDLHLQAGRPAEARGFLERGMALGAEVGDRLMQSLCRVSLAEVCTGEGRLDEAAGLLAGAKADADSMKADNLLAVYHRVAGLLEAAKGDASSARGHFEKSIEIHARLNEGFPLARAKRTFALFCAKSGDPSTANKMSGEVLEFAKAAGAGSLEKAVLEENPHLDQPTDSSRTQA
ncbi:MAG: tetratricopeptide repeat protein [Methanobacteriota archaeon]